jgi:osmotically-inducible protein OsmY
MDKTIRTDVLDELEFEPSLDEKHIGVAVAEAIVTLTGHVPTFIQKLAAETAALRVRGVRAVANELEVRTADQSKRADDEIAQRVVDILSWDSLVPKGAIQATVRNGWVTLAGEVAWMYQRVAAEDAVRKLSGVSGIHNNIMIRAAAEAGDVKTKIEAALRRRAEIDAARIKVSVSNGSVTLDGVVRDWQERQAIEQAAWSAPGVLSVKDRIRVA